MSTNKLSINSTIKELHPRISLPILKKLIEADIYNIRDLLSIHPLRVQLNPVVQSFDHMQVDQLFRGKGQVVHVQAYPAYKRFGKGRIQLFNVTVHVKDDLSSQTATLRWFNAYPNVMKKLKESDHLTFMGKVQNFKNITQIINPDVSGDEDHKELLIQYPTFNTIQPRTIQMLIGRIPPYLWQEIPDSLPGSILKKRNFTFLSESLKIIHGHTEAQGFKEKYSNALKRIVYEDFFNDQLKIIVRRESIKKKKAPIFTVTDRQIEQFLKCFPYEFTPDQLTTLQEIRNDFLSGHPMMRLVQGDVGSGKTSVALVASLMTMNQGFDVALMCPTESLATQHFETFKKLLPPEFPPLLLLGSQKVSERKVALKQLLQGEFRIVIGTHSLIQESVKFKNLGLAIIDEQHKFGVEQRLKLLAKGKGVHSLIMTATPIPRTLQLARYGDLDISSIKTMPKGRKGIQTRIVQDGTYEKYLSFVKTRVTLGEQVYIVVPAIEESEVMDLNNVNEIFEKYKKYFPEFKIEVLHGKMKSEEKNTSLLNFMNKKSQILIATSVIEVGIDVPNATVMSIYNPERFGLSSLHQLRGRVGRGEKPGFCFLVATDSLSMQSRERLEVIEKNLDGFVIAEADLRIRGEGDLFGVNQSGTLDDQKLASVYDYPDLFEKVLEDLKDLKTHSPEVIEPLVQKYRDDAKVASTI